MAQILLVEDNPSIGTDIKEYLELEKHHITRKSDGLEGIESALSNYYDLIILDVMLPGIDGFSFCKQLRETKSVPIIMTTAKGTLDDKQEGFDGGADDYLVKPFALKELTMRIDSLLKRTKQKDVWQQGSITVFLDENEVIKDTKKIHLTTKERIILAELIDAQGSVVSRTSLIEAVRGSDNLWENDNKLDVYIANLRKKLDRSLIKTIKGVGYKIHT